MNKVLVILGMHRSGTSLITQWLYKCGLHIGNNLIGSSESNKDGHFEDWDFVRIHEQILHHNNLDSSGLVNKSFKITEKYYLEKLNINIEFKNRLNQQWGWKDPRTCLFLEYYIKAVPEAKYLIILRDYKAVVNSLVKRKFKENEELQARKVNALRRLKWRLLRHRYINKYYKELSDKYLEVWIRYNEILLAHVNKTDRANFLLVDYKLLFSQSKAVFDVLTNDWNFQLNYIDFNNIFKKELISDARDVLSFITNKKLIEKADTLMNELQQFSFLKHAEI